MSRRRPSFVRASRLAWAGTLIVGFQVSSPPPATASTLPPLDGGPGRLTVALGLLDAAVDMGVANRLSLGLTAFMPPVGILGIAGIAGRATVWATDPQRWAVLGVTLSAGATTTSGGMSSTRLTWAQPALNVAIAPGETGWALRATAGPVLALETVSRPGAADTTGTSFMPLIPNLEVAYRFSRHNELTLGGNGLIGWRGRY